VTKIKCEVVQCTEKGHCKQLAIFGVDESSVPLWWKHKAVISECEALQKKFTGHKNDFLKWMTQSSQLFKRDTRLE
jgi:hypothetical protein